MVATAIFDRLRALPTPAAILLEGLTAAISLLSVDRLGFGVLQPDGRTIEFHHFDLDGVEILNGEYSKGAFGLDGPAKTLPTAVRFPAETTVTLPVIRERKLKAALHLNRSAGRAAWGDAEITFAVELGGPHVDGNCTG